MTELARWSDDRLDDLLRQVRHQGDQINALSDLKTEMAALRQKVDDIGGDAHDCLADLRNLKGDLDKRAVDQAKERKADRRWMIATLLTTAGLVIAALAIFLG